MLKQINAIICAKEVLDPVSLGDDKIQEAILLTFKDKRTDEKIIVKVLKHLCFYVGNIKQITDDNVFPQMQHFNVGDECEVKLGESPTIKASFGDNEPEKWMFILKIRNVYSGITAIY